MDTIYIIIHIHYILGALTGFLSSLAFTFWMSFGQPRPSTKKLFLSIDKCANINDSLMLKQENFFGNDTTLDDHDITKSIISQVNNLNTTFASAKEEENYFYLYRISYTWYAFIGFTLTLVIGTISSLVYHRLYYSNRISCNDIDPDLFITPIRKSMLAKRFKNSEKYEHNKDSKTTKHDQMEFDELNRDEGETYVKSEPVIVHK